MNGLPYAVTRKVRSPVGLAAMMRGQLGEEGLFRKPPALVSRLAGHEAQPAVPDVLAAERHHVATPHARKQQEGERQRALVPIGCRSTNCRDLIGSPGVEARRWRI